MSVAIVGVGLIGGSIGKALQARRLAERIIGVGRSAASLAEARRHGAVTETTRDLAAGVAAAELVVVTAGAKQKPGQTRMDLAGSTVALMQKVIPTLVERSPGATVIMVTNPVDVTTQAALKISGLALVDADVPGWKKIVKSEQLPFVAPAGEAAEGVSVDELRARTGVAFDA